MIPFVRIIVSEVAAENKRKPSTEPESCALVNVTDTDDPEAAVIKTVLVYDTDSENKYSRSRISEDEDERTPPDPRDDRNAHSR